MGYFTCFITRMYICMYGRSCARAFAHAQSQSKFVCKVLCHNIIILNFHISCAPAGQIDCKYWVIVGHVILGQLSNVPPVHTATPLHHLVLPFTSTHPPLCPILIYPNTTPPAKSHTQPLFPNRKCLVRIFKYQLGRTPFDQAMG